jgi:integrase
MNKIKYELVTHRVHGGMLAIFVKCSQYGSVIELDTNVRVFNDEWSEESGLISKSPNAANLNLLIRKLVYNLEDIELTYSGEITLSKLHDIYSKRGASADWYAMWEKSMNERGLKPRTIEIHTNVLKTIKKFKGSCPVISLTEDFFRGFMGFLINSGLKYSTVCKEMHVVKTYYNIARKLYGNKVPSDAFAFYHDPKDLNNTYKLKSLSDDDIRKIENYVASGTLSESKKLTINQFLFMSYSGTRISDFASLNEKNFKLENDRIWLEYNSVKTNTHVRIPLFALFDGRGEQIYSQYQNRLSEFFYVGSNCRFNSRLSSALKGSGLNKHVTAHVARHTCASRLINRNVPITTIQQVIGHRQIKTTMIYAKIDDNSFVRQLKGL